MAEKLNYYYDTREGAINRGLEEYKEMAFNDDSDNWLSDKPEGMNPNNPQEWSLRHYHSLKHFIPKKEKNNIVCQEDDSVQYEWDWQGKKVFGGLDNFFTKGARVLDVGSGTGRAVREINEQFIDKNVNCIGVDARYFKEDSHDPNLVAGSLDNLPFKDNSFDRILGVESFPAWLPDDEKSIDKNISEITRVSRLGTIWRGTLPHYDENDKIKFSVDQLTDKFVEHGWEVVTSKQDHFFARLIYKEEK